MNVLWFATTPSNYKGLNGNGYNGGGWISSLESEIDKHEDIGLSIAFFSKNQPFKVRQNRVTYYPMSHPIKSKREKINYFLHYSVEDEAEPYINLFRKIIEDCKPDIIEIFGSETVLGFAQSATTVPCVLHIQGILTPYWNAFCPPFISKKTYLFATYSPIRILKVYKKFKTWTNSCVRELSLLKNISYFIGRTDWDKRMISILNPQSCYFYGSEILRQSFYQKLEYKKPEEMTIVSTMSGVMYKGMDLILKTAYVLKYMMNQRFTWIVYGDASNLKFFERSTSICHSDVNVEMKGVGTEKDICQTLINATAFAQTSYIDNSPNAVCEAQIMGCPVVATHVGGLSSLIENGMDGFLVPANDPYQMAWLLYNLHTDEDLSSKISKNAKETASMRHNKKDIVDSLILTYQKIISLNKE